MQDIYISIGQNIRRRRKEKHLTQVYHCAKSSAMGVIASTSFFSQELASQLNSCTPQQQQFLMSFISWFLQQSTPFSE